MLDPVDSIQYNCIMVFKNPIKILKYLNSNVTVGAGLSALLPLSRLSSNCTIRRSKCKK